LAQIVPEKIRIRGRLRWYPTPLRWRGQVRTQPNEGGQYGQSRHTVGDRMMEFDQQYDAALFHPRYKPHLPKGLRTVQVASSQLLARIEKVVVAARGIQAVGTDMICYVEFRGVDPQRCAQPEWGSMNHLAETGNEVEPLFDQSSNGP
jgi:hypothetical protein